MRRSWSVFWRKGPADPGVRHFGLIRRGLHPRRGILERGPLPGYPAGVPPLGRLPGEFPSPGGGYFAESAGRVLSGPGAAIWLGGIFVNLWIYVGIAAGAVLLLMWMAAWCLTRMITHPRVRDPEEGADEVCTLMGVSRAQFEREHPSEPFEIVTEDGCTLRGSIMRRREAPEDGRERVVILVHGYTACAAFGWKYADIFLELGFSCVLYDNRNHGRSDRRPTTMGPREAEDLVQVAEWVRGRFGAGCVLGLHGESMGASTVMLAAPRIPGLAFAVEDCGYSDLREELAHVCANRYHVPRVPFLAMASLIYRASSGVFLSGVSPRTAVAECGEIPMLFVHGEADDFVPTRMVYENYAAKEGKKEIFTVPGAGHAESVLVDREGYKGAVYRVLPHRA